AEKPSLRAASCCIVDVVNGAGGLRFVGFASTPEVKRLDDQVIALSGDLYSIGQYSSAIIKGLKCALSILGICDDYMASPFSRFHDAEQELIGAYLQKHGVPP
ncbi:MAG: hypothetical protein AAF357_09555, partial [Verrucomicrobiota bacterium]